MSTRFAANHGLIVVSARVMGPGGDNVVRLALDTGATTTLIRGAVLTALGYHPTHGQAHVRITTGSGVELVPRFLVQRIEALGHARIDFPILAHTLPPTALVDGLLGLDFMREQRLTIDF